MLVAVTVRPLRPYPHAELLAGIKAAGDKLVTVSDEAIATWNCYGAPAKEAARIRGLGGVHVCLENGYLARDKGYYLVERNGFNGRGRILYSGMSGDRFSRLGLTIHPRKKRDNNVVLVCGQRGGSYSPLAMPNDWPEQVINELASYTDREIWYRPHPERQRLPKKLPHNAYLVDPNEPLERFLRQAHAVVVWTSNSATEVLLAGVPVIYQGPSLIAQTLASNDLRQVENPRWVPDEARRRFFYDLAYRQFHRDELADGTAWKWVAHADR